MAGDSTRWRGSVGARVGVHRLTRPLGGGEDTEVWLADGPRGRVAIKRLRHRRDPTAALRLAREVTALDRLAQRVGDIPPRPDEPAWLLPRIVDLGDVPGDPWLATAFEHARPLAGWEGMAGDPGAALLILSALARALGAVHEAGVVHRDVKPDNVLVGASGVVLIDFAACAVLGTTFDGHIGGRDAVVGTPRFQAPEAGRVDAALSLDVFSLGVVAHDLLGRDVGILTDRHRGVLVRARSADPAERPTTAELDAVFHGALVRQRGVGEGHAFGRSWSALAAGWEPVVTLDRSHAPVSDTQPVDLDDRPDDVGLLRRHSLDAAELMTAMITAESGRGKTFHLDHSSECAAGDGWLVVRSSCDSEHDGLDAIRPWLAQLDFAAPRPGRSALARRVVPLMLGTGGARSAPGGGDQLRLSTSELVDVVVELIAACGPTLCILDDIHHGDERLCEFLGKLAGRAVMAVVLAAGRPGGPDADDLSAVTVALPDLDDEAIAGIAGAVLGRDVTPDELAVIVAASGRQPLLVQEMASALGSGESLFDTTLADLAGRRLLRMSSKDRVTAELFAVGGMGCWPELFGRSATATAVQLVADGVLECRLRSRVPGTTELRFVHAAIRDAVDALVIGPDRIPLHEQIGDALHRAGAPADLAAPHAVAATLGGVMRMVPLAVDLSIEAAGIALRDFSPARARRHVVDARLVMDGVADDSGPGTGDRDRHDRLDLVDAELLLLEGDPALALTLAENVTRPAGGVAVRSDLIALRAHLELGDYAAAIEFGEQLLGGLRGPAPVLTDRDLALIELDLAVALTRNGRAAEAVVAADRAVQRLDGSDSVERAGARTVAALAAAELAFEGKLLPVDSRNRALEAWDELRDAEPRRWVGRAAELIDAIFWTDWSLARKLAAEAAAAAQSLGAHAAFAKLACFAADFALEADEPDLADLWLDQIVGAGAWDAHVAVLRSVAEVGRSPQQIERSVAQLVELAERNDGLADDVSLVARADSAAAMLWQGRPRAMRDLIESFPADTARRVSTLLAPSVALVEGVNSTFWPDHAISESMDPDLPAGPLSYLDRALFRYLIGDRDGGDAAVRACVRGRHAAGVELPRRVSMAGPQYLICALGPPDVEPPIDWFAHWFRQANLPGVWVVHRAVIAMLLAERGESGFDRSAVLALLDTVPAEPEVRRWIVERTAGAEPQ